jgi:CRP/FNR family cyclic AMP-dependent transcriptional regulator
MNEDLAGILQTSVPLFRGFSKDETNELLSICKIRTFQAGEVLIEAGTPSTGMFLILSGELVAKTEEGHPLIQLSRPDTVGEMGIFTGETRSANVEGLRPGSVVQIDQTDMSGILQQDPLVAHKLYGNVIHILAARLRNEGLVIRMLRDQTEALEDKVLSEEQPPDEKDDLELDETVERDETSIVKDFYGLIGIEEMPNTHEKDHQAYDEMRKQGLSEQQIWEIARWTAKNIRGVKEFVLVKYCMGEALRK